MLFDLVRLLHRSRTHKVDEVFVFFVHLEIEPAEILLEWEHVRGSDPGRISVCVKDNHIVSGD